MQFCFEETYNVCMVQEQSNKPSRKKKIVNKMMDRAVNAINDADEAVAAKRVKKLRKKQPNLDEAELVNLLIKQKCLQTGAIGAITSSSSMIPGLGTVVSLTFGVAAEIGLTFKMQAELVLEIAAVYKRELSDVEKRTAVLTVTGISSGVTQVAERAGKQVAIKASERLAQQSIAKAIPVIGVAASSGTNVVTTYVIGRRANAYFSLGPEEMGEWDESIRALTGVDERKMTRWLSETTENSWRKVKGGFEDVTEAVITVGQSTGELVAVGADKTKNVVVWAVGGIGSGVKAMVVGTKTAVSNAGQAIVETSGNVKDRTVDLFRRDESEAEPITEPESVADADEESTFVEKAFNLLKRGRDEEEDGRSEDETIEPEEETVSDEGGSPSLIKKAFNAFKRDTDEQEEEPVETPADEQVDEQMLDEDEANSSFRERALKLFQRNPQEEE